MRIAIVGAGIGGLAAALFLERQGHLVTVFEQFDEPAPVGSGLIVQPVGLKVLEDIGLSDAVRVSGTPIHRILGHNSETGKRVLDVAYGAAPGLGIHRSSLFSALYNKAKAVGINWRTGHRVTGRGGPRLLLDQARTSLEFDLIVDASGAGSKLSPLKATRLGFGAIWGTVDYVGGVPIDHLSQRYRRADRMIGILPIGYLAGSSKPKAALFWSLKQERYQDWLAGGLERWKEEAIGLWPEVEPYVCQISEPEQMTMARYSHGTLWRLYDEKIAYIGDAAHRTSPQLGQGANMALLDAAALAQALERHSIDEALMAYARVRRWHVQAYQAVSAMFTPAYQSESRVLPIMRDRLLFPVSQIPPMPYLLSRLVSGTLIPTGLRS